MQTIEILVHPLFKEIKPHVVQRFSKFHEQNPHYHDLVKKFAYEALNSGRKRFGMKMICERIRWYTEIEVVGSAYKAQNNYTSCYSRLLIIEDERFSKIFKTKSTTKKQYKNDGAFA